MVHDNEYRRKEKKDSNDPSMLGMLCECPSSKEGFEFDWMNQMQSFPACQNTMRRSLLTNFGHKLSSSEYSSVVDKLASTLPAISPSDRHFQNRYISLLVDSDGVSVVS